MNIVKYKRSSNGKYKIELDGNNELVLYEEVILKNELLLKKEIGEQLISILLEENREWEAYYIALKSLKAHFRSGKELSDILLKKDYPQELVDKTINKLLDQGYINDTSFSRSYINNQMMTTNKGPNKIINELLNKGVILEIVQKEISIFNEDIQRKKLIS